MAKYVYRGVRYLEDEDALRVKRKAALEKKLDMPLTWRQYNLIIDDIDAPAITRGRPVVSHSLAVDSKLTDKHIIQGLDSGLEQQKLLADMQRRKRGY